MGKILFIRVSAQTYSEEAMKKAWPTLIRLAYPDSSPKDAEKWRDAGVLGLVTALSEGVHFSLYPAEVIAKIKKHTDKLTVLKEAIDKALGDQNVTEAKLLANEIEDALTEAEDAINK